MRSKNICVDLRMVSASGIGRYLRNVVPWVIQSLDNIHFYLIGDKSKLSKFAWSALENITIIHNCSPIYSIEEQFTIPKLIPKDTTLFWATHYNIPILYRSKLLVTVYDLFHLAMPSSLVGGIHKKYYAWLMFNAIAKKADAIITISQFTKNEILRLTKCSEDIIFPIHLGIDTNYFVEKIGDIKEGRPYILFVGNVKPHKNLVSLVSAFHKCIELVDHDLVIVGQREGFITGDARVAEVASELGNRVRFTGHISDSELVQYYKQADLFVFPSLYEGFGFPPLEAMACGCPVLAASNGSIPEICGDAVLYFSTESDRDLKDKILLILKDRSMRKELIKKGHKRVKLFGWDECANKTINVISKLIM